MLYIFCHDPTITRVPLLPILSEPILGINCEGGLVYSACHPMCETTCNALSSNSVCDETCVEGCACPDGSVMAPHGACVAPENCGCVDPDSDETYAPGERIEKGCGFW